MEAVVPVTDMRQCDLCDAIKPIGAKWWFVSEGKSKPSEWQLAQHWCDACMQFLRQQHVA